jgi:hypothetical protein
MLRKRWTATKKEEVTESLLNFREKRKWQIALRRYILEGNKGSYYAPYFGIDSKSFRSWIEVQFDENLNWSNFSKEWQFDHIVPVAYFRFSNEADLRLCWNFTNIRVEKLQLNKNRGHRIDVLAAKSYFQTVYNATGYNMCLEMVGKIEQLEVSQIESNLVLEQFVLDRKSYLQILSTFSAYEFEQLNSGLTVDEILEERKFLARHNKNGD